MRYRLLYLVSHPIQYQAPLLRLIAADPGIRLKVLFGRIPEGAIHDPGFGRSVEWDVPLRDGYDSALATPKALAEALSDCDAVWLHGWQTPLFRRIIRHAPVPVLMRGENWEGAMPDRGLKGWLKRHYLRRLFARCAAFLAIGSANRDYYLARDIAPDRVFMVPYAVDNAFFAAGAAAARPERERLRAELGLEPGRKVILFSGKLQRRKRPDLLLQAWMREWPEGERPELVVVGDGEMRAELEEMGAGARFVGFRNQTQLPALYDLADAFVLPSEREPWGLAVNEAMAAGTAVVVSDQVGSAFDLVDESCGRVFVCGDAEALGKALREVLAHSDAMGRAAADKVGSWDFAADLAGLKQALVHVAGGERE